MNHSKTFLSETAAIAAAIDVKSCDDCVKELVAVRERAGRLFILGNGGSAANASHAVNDFRKICQIEAYAPTDNVAELTARTNDDGWDSVYQSWLVSSRLCEKDLLLVLSVGGGQSGRGDRLRSTSVNICSAVHLAKNLGCPIIGIVGRSGGVTKQFWTCGVMIPDLFPIRTTPHQEAFQAVIWHLWASHPYLIP